MNIAFCISSLGCGGAQRVLINVLKEINVTNLNIYVVTLYGEECDHFELPKNIKRIVIGYTKNEKGFLKSVQYNLKRIMSLRKVLVQHDIQCAMSFIGIMNILLVLATMKLSTKVIISERNDPEKQPLGMPWDYLRKKFYCDADIVTANSHGALKILSAYVPEEKLLYLPNPLPEVAGVVVDKKFDNKKIIKLLAVGRLHKQKNYHILLEALSYCVSNSDYKYILTILGDGPLYEELNELSIKLNVNENIIWTKNVLLTEKHYLESDVYILASAHEGMPNSLLEAMAYQLPVIISDGSEGPREIIEDDVNGFIVKAGSPSELAKKINHLAEDSALRKRLSMRAMNDIQSHDNKNIINIWKGLFK